MLAVALMVIEVEMRSSGMPAKRRSMSSMESMATPTLPTSPSGHGRVGVVADLRGQIEGDGKPGGSLGEQEFVAAVALFGVAHAGVLAHGPEAAAVHGGLDAAGEGKFAGEAEVAVGGKGGEVVGGVEGFRDFEMVLASEPAIVRQWRLCGRFSARFCFGWRARRS